MASDYLPCTAFVSAVAGRTRLGGARWLVGVCLLALRIAFGLLFLERLRRRNLTALPAAFVERCRTLQQRLGISRVVRYCECRLVSVPAVIGFFRPVVLLPMRALTGLSPMQLEAVIAHELGHIKRFDVAVNFFQVMAETLFFFHPAVWWLNKRIRADREDCCDDLAIAACGERAGLRARAGHHGRLARGAGFCDGRDRRLRGRARGAAARRQRAECRHASRRSAHGNAGAHRRAVSRSDFPGSLVEPAEARDYFGAEPVLLAQADAKPAPAPKSQPARREAGAASKPSPAAKPRTRSSHQLRESASPRNSYIAQMKAAGYDDLDVDDLIAMRVHEVTPEYIEAIRDMGFSVDPDEVVAMKVHDITPEYVRDIRALGFKPDADEIIAMKVHDITPDYVQKMRALGFEADADELIALKVHDVTAEYRDALAAAGYKLDAEEIIHAKVMDITPEFIAQVRAHGFKDLSMEQLIQLKNADVL